ncbi:hypothetical protein OK351_04985 [Glutamicibacter sp. MNS18]|uniref:hypothetical protein n=1 Tax=Glutamicibacter sp. MNS18 TaxID=2989817 RepID=UPI0022361B99|nr:hypothetical protein [Glutamicibacter sp. MNS18]MCW4464861.1 hypothetical protein [Glutamicibacter sp. MNS18]
MATSTILLLGSVFLSEQSMVPLAHRLGDLGYRTDVCARPNGASADLVLQRYRESLSAEGPQVLLAHSNAGLYLPALLAGSTQTSAVFMDCIVPAFTGGQLPTVPADLGKDLSARAVNGLLPPWTSWWPAAAIRDLVTEEAEYQELLEQTPQVPEAYLHERLRVPRAWHLDVPAGYLLLSPGYQAELDRARDAGWPTAELSLGHLGMLRDPALVAQEVSRLIAVMS